MRLLVIEDDRKVAALLRKGLEEEGHETAIASDGEEGLALALEGAYDLLVLDVMLPLKDGMELLRELRGKGRKVPVLILTARDAVEDRVRGLDAGADDYLVKPFAVAELLARVRVLLRREKEDKFARLALADLSLDPARRKAWRASREIDLTPREFALLEYLLRNAGQVLTRPMIAQHVWSCGFDSFSNVIDVYVNFLRAKIDRDFEPKLLHTVRGVGYVLREGGAVEAAHRARGAGHA
ncbi:MAG: response regulator [Planctomycetes bacterium]|nr:response regulator [Planctomycetota bacterium]